MNNTAVKCHTIFDFKQLKIVIIQLESEDSLHFECDYPNP